MKKTKKVKKAKNTPKRKNIAKSISRKKTPRKTKRTKKTLIDQVQLDILLKKGEARSFITSSEILYAFPKIEKDIEGLEEIYDNFKERGIEIKEVQEFLEVKTKKEKKEKKASVGKIDPIQIYLKEIGKTGFLTAKEDITYEELATHIAKKIGVSQRYVQPIKAHDSGLMFETIPKHTTLDTSRIENELGFIPPNVWDTIDSLFGLKYGASQ